MYTVLYVWVPELFPTDIRSVGFGFGSMISRIAGFLVPLVLALGTIPQNIVFMSFAFISALTVLYLPETKGKPLTHTIEDAKRFYKS